MGYLKFSNVGLCYDRFFVLNSLFFHVPPVSVGSYMYIRDKSAFIW